MQARIYLPTKNAMQSGKANSRRWVLDFEPEAIRRLDPLMGWTGTTDMNGEVRMTFESKEAAIAYCEKHRIPFEVQEPKPFPLKIKTYADNFRYDKVR
ncbi:ETC complex I subunit [Zavarzinia sp.]|uniref:ETC complex I subunit n=1 Tax=Zavarzinia sp. TaxID=2027920 RepID=UPI003BB80D17